MFFERFTLVHNLRLSTNPDPEKYVPVQSMVIVLVPSVLVLLNFFSSDILAMAVLFDACSMKIMAFVNDNSVKIIFKGAHC